MLVKRESRVSRAGDLRGGQNFNEELFVKILVNVGETPNRLSESINFYFLRNAQNLRYSFKLIPLHWFLLDLCEPIVTEDGSSSFST